MLLQNPQEGNLGLGWKFSDFIQEGVPPFANSNRPKRCWSWRPFLLQDGRQLFRIRTANLQEPSLCRLSTRSPVPCQLCDGPSGDNLKLASLANHSHAK